MLVGYGLVTLGEFLQLALLCVVITLLSGILQELKWHGELLRAQCKAGHSDRTQHYGWLVLIFMELKSLVFSV